MKSIGCLVCVVVALALGGCGGPPSSSDAGRDATDTPHDSATPMDAARDATPDHGAPDACAGMMCGASCVDTQTDVHHCGGCATDCTALANVAAGGASCAAGACVIASCAPGRADCNHAPADGCEADLTSAASCGACGASCAEPTPMCTMGVADGGGYGCASGCTGATPTRCAMACVDTQTDVNHCGGCDQACPVVANGQATCAAGSCGTSCDAGFHLCGAACVSDADPASCGASCTPCAAPPNTTPTCDGTACGVTCVAGFADCNGNMSDGCEVDTRSSGTNCGACGHACGCGACTDGACGNELVAGEGAPFALGINAGVLYWGDDTSHAVRTVPVTGGTATTLFPGRTAVRGIASDGTYLYFTRYLFQIVERGGLDGSGGGNFTNAQEQGPIGIVADAAGVYWVDNTSGLVRTGRFLSGTTLATGQTNAAGIAMDATNLYWTTNRAGGTVMRMPRAGGTPVQLAGGQGNPWGIAVDASYVYWVSQLDGTVNRVPIAGGAVVQLATGQAYPYTIAVDATNVYWTNFNGGTVASVPVGGGPVRVLASGVNQPLSIVQDAAHVYFTSYAGGVDGAGSICVANK